MKKQFIVFALLTIAITSCKQHTEQATLENFIEVENNGHTIQVPIKPKNVAVLERGIMENMDELGIPFQGMAKEFTPKYLAHLEKDKSIADLGAVFKPNFDAVSHLSPDLIFMDNAFPADYDEMIKIGTTLMLGIPNKGDNYLKYIQDNLTLLGKIYEIEPKAETLAKDLDTRVKQLKSLVATSNDKAMLIIHSEGSFRLFDENTRYGFIFKDFGVKSATNITTEIANNHGQIINSEFILEHNPDILFIIDRDAIVQNTDKPVRISNALLEKTNAFKNNKVIYLNPDAWFLSGSGATSFKIFLEDISKGYK
ncbi:siderophore ABC transporter substrate-binding protein [Myroides marinus]|uniref:siderophore ABC transporter substrate-binding protein n=1 Tax=Myroides marinus TaxID=703342 RepID=UPI002574EBE6|nr:ABC transporter substrate-binding protein [Myroides marinus]MDM1346882.1 ABC transporter substrate-binding protein [Myroides marinus]MDM1405678.1 ABC transporter substrate-binding protein [Myroides marinus]